MSNPARNWLLLALAISGAMACVAWRVGRPWIVSDTATGLHAWHDWRAGGPWNCLLEPDPANLARNQPNWVSWWSPGQYVWPGAFAALGLNLGPALILSAVVAAWIRSFGFFALLRATGLEPRAAGVATAVEAANWHLFTSFGMYNGGEVLQAALFPWLLLALFRLRSRPRRWLLLVPLLLFVSAFAKHSLFIAGVGGAAWMWREADLTTHRPWPRRLASAAAIGGAVLIAHFAIQHWIVGNGPTPASPGQVHHGWMVALGFPALAPLSAATGLGSLMGRVFMVLGIEAGSGWQRLAVALVLLAPVWLAAYALLARCVSALPFQRLFVAMLGVYIGALALLYARGASVSIEDRHARPAGMLVLAAIAAIATTRSTARPLLRHGCAVLLAGIALFGVGAEIARAATLARLDCVGPSGLSQPNLSRRAAAELVRRDSTSAGGDQVIFVCDPSIALEVKHSRVIVSDALARPLAWFASRRWHGRVGRLLLVLPASWADDPREAALRACFVDYQPAEWRRDVVGDSLFISAGSGASS